MTLRIARPSSHEEVIVFVHVPKTAGRTFRHLLRSVANNEGIVEITGGGHTYDAETAASRTDASTRIVMGHINYGIHRWIDRPCRYITILRDPLERLVSYYHFICRTETHISHRQVSKMRLEAFAASDIIADLDNGHTRAIAGRPDFGSRPIKNPVTNEDLDVAKQKLAEDFSVFGIQERFEETVLLMSKRLGWGRVSYRSVNRAARKPRSGEIAPAAAEVIRERNRFDYDLYDWATLRFEADVKSELKARGMQIVRLRTENRLRSLVSEARRHLRG